MLRPACLLPAARLSPPRRLSTPRSGPEGAPRTWSLLPGAPALSGTVLSPARVMQRDTADIHPPEPIIATSSRRTMTTNLRSTESLPSYRIIRTGQVLPAAPAPAVSSRDFRESLIPHNQRVRSARSAAGRLLAGPGAIEVENGNDGYRSGSQGAR